MNSKKSIFVVVPQCTSKNVRRKELSSPNKATRETSINKVVDESEMPNRGNGLFSIAFMA